MDKTKNEVLRVIYQLAHSLCSKPTVGEREKAAEKLYTLIENHVNGWIPVSERLPEQATEVMVCVEGNTFWWGSIYDEQWFIRYGADWQPSDCITHWKPLPPPPENNDE